MWLFAELSRAQCLMQVKALVQRLELHWKRVPAGQLVAPALLQVCGAEALAVCERWSLTMGQLSPGSDVRLLGTGEIVLFNWFPPFGGLAWTIMFKQEGTGLQLQIRSFFQVDKLLLFVLWSKFANKAGLSEYSENNW